MSIRGPIRIDVWKGDWGLPSVDLECLQFLAYIKINAIDMKITNVNNPYFTPEGKLPVIRLKDRNISRFEDLVKYMEDKNMNPDYGLNRKQQAEAQAYRTLLKEKLFPALQYVWWLDQNNETGVTTPWYSRILPIPFNFYYPGKFKREAEGMLTALFDNYENDKDIESKVIGDAEKCLTAISIRLGSSDFIFGSHPTSIDATLYAYLAPLLKAPLRSTGLQNHLKACTNLNKYVSRMSQRYFSQDYNEYEAKRKKEMKAQKEQVEQDPTLRRNQFIAVFVALAAMYGYAVSTGALQKLH
uniref:Metaxin-1 n=1 Tax=Lygus hesperus TaxID=30085 RepID=A0A0A9Z5R4_LYGHE